MVIIKFSEEWTPTPPGREMEGHPPHNYSGKKFRKQILDPLIEKKQFPISIDFDGTRGMPPSFAGDAFGSIAKEIGTVETLNMFEFKSEIRPYIASTCITQIKRYGSNTNE